MGRKAFGPSKRQACDLHHCKKKKKTLREKPSKQAVVMHEIDRRGI